MFISKKEVAEILNVSEKTIERWVKDTNIPYSRVGNILRFDKEEVINWFKSQK